MRYHGWVHFIVRVCAVIGLTCCKVATNNGTNINNTNVKNLPTSATHQSKHCTHPHNEVHSSSRTQTRTTSPRSHNLERKRNVSIVSNLLLFTQVKEWKYTEDSLKQKMCSQFFIVNIPYTFITNRVRLFKGGQRQRKRAHFHIFGGHIFIYSGGTYSYIREGAYSYIRGAHIHIFVLTDV